MRNLTLTIRRLLSITAGVRLGICALILLTPLVCAAEGKIAFFSNREGNSEIYVMNADGSNQTRLTNHPAEDRTPTFSSDGSKIAFESDRAGSWDIFVMNADGSNLINLTNDSANDIQPSISPDGSHVAFVSDRDGNREIYTVDANGTNLRRLTYFSPASDGSPSFSYDGSKIVFVSNRGGWGSKIFVMNSDGSNQIQVTSEGCCEFNYEPSFSPDGSKIVFSRDDGNNLQNRIVIINADGTELTYLPSNAYSDRNPSFSPDGIKIAFVSHADSSAESEIYIMNTDGTAKTRLTFSHPFIESDPSWVIQGGTAPPALSNVSVASPINENDSAVLLGNISSPNASHSFTLTVNWGDGSPAQVLNYPAGTTSFAETHQYRDDDPTATASDNYTINLTLTTGAGSDTDSTVVTVNNVVPTLTGLSLNPATLTSGGTTTLSGSVNDVGTQDAHTVVIDWGDGSAATTLNLAPGVSAFSQTHLYNTAGSFSIGVTVTDDDGGTTSETLNVNSDLGVAPAAPTDLRIDYVGTNQANIRWTDNSNNESGFVIEQCRAKNCGTSVQVAQVGPNTTTYLLTGLLANSQYLFRVRAFNNAGSSAYSNVLTVRTLRK